jgi:hypothetical protein
MGSDSLAGRSSPSTAIGSPASTGAAATTGSGGRSGSLGVPQFDNDLEVFFHCVKPTYWEGCMAEAIDLAGDFYWITHNPDEKSLAVLERRGRMNRLIPCSGKDDPEECARIRLRLEPFAE